MEWMVRTWRVECCAVIMEGTGIRFCAMAAGLGIRHGTRENGLCRGVPVRHLGHACDDVGRYRKLPEEARIIVVPGVAPTVIKEIQFGAGERPAGGLID